MVSSLWDMLNLKCSAWQSAELIQHDAQERGLSDREATE